MIWIVLGVNCGGEFRLADASETHDETSTDSNQAGDIATAIWQSSPWSEVRGASCMPLPDGTPVPCDLELAPDRRSTLCDQELGRCVPPAANCADGWCYIPPRSFLSGAGLDGSADWSTAPGIAAVRYPFRIRETETTLDEFVAVMGFVPDGTTGCGGDCPVAGISVFAAMQYANLKSLADGFEPCYILEKCDFEVLLATPNEIPYETWTCESSTWLGAECTGYHLPTRFEWELAARGGSPYCLEIGPKNLYGCEHNPEWLDERARFCGNARGTYARCPVPRHDDLGTEVCLGLGPVREKRRNAFGLFGTNGSVYDFVQLAGPTSESAVLLRATLVDASQEIRHDDLVFHAGGNFALEAEGICPWQYDLWPHTGNAIQSQTAGFRIVQTLPVQP